MTRVDILYIDHCPHVQPTTDRVRAVADRLGLEVELRMVRIGSPEEADLVRFPGSPTVRVNGVDISPLPSDHSDFGLCCRTYDGAGVPSEKMIDTALRFHV